MAAWQRESGVAKGRGFGTVDGVPGYLNRLKTWIVKSPASGGPGWYIIDDQSMAFPDPYIVVSDMATQTNANKAKILQFRLVTSASDVIEMVAWMWWNTSTHVGTLRYGGYSLSTQENAEFEYNFRGGPEGLFLMSRIGTSWDYAYIDEWEGIPNLLESASLEGTLQQDYAAVLNDAGNQVTEFGRLTGIGPHLDASGKLYVSVVVSGSSSQIFIYKDSARTQLIAQTTNASTIGTVAVTAQNSSGVGGSIRRNAVTSTDSDIEVDFTLHFGSGEGANFTVGKFYFIWDVTQATIQGAYFKVLGKIGDQIIPDYLNNVFLRSGSVASPYGHRYCVGGSQVTNMNPNPWLSFAVDQIPYISVLGVTQGNFIFSDTYSGAYLSNNSSHYSSGMLLLDPDDEGRYSVMRAIVTESQDRNSSPMNRIYGRSKNRFITSSAGLAQMSDGRIINGQEFICFTPVASNQVTTLVRHSTSLS